MPGFRIDIYIVRAIMRPALSVYAVALVCLTLEQSIRLTNILVEQKGPAKVVIGMLLNILPEYIAQGLQISFFLGVLLGFRGLARENSITALYSAGIPLQRLIRPVLVLASLAGLISLVTAGILQPRGEYLFAKTGQLLSQGAFGIPIKSKQWMQADQETLLYVQNASPSGKKLSGVFIEERQQNGRRIITSAREGYVLSGNPINGYVLELAKGRQIIWPDKNKTAGVLNFEKFRFTLKTPIFPEFREPGFYARETTLLTLWRKAYGRNDDNGSNRREFQLRFTAILIYGLAFLPMSAIAAALGAGASIRSNDWSIPIGISILIAFMQTMGAAERGAQSPFLIMWPVFLSLCLTGVLMVSPAALSRRSWARTLSVRKLRLSVAGSASPGRKRTN